MRIYESWYSWHWITVITDFGIQNPKDFCFFSSGPGVAKSHGIGLGGCQSGRVLCVQGREREQSILLVSGVLWEQYHLYKILPFNSSLQTLNHQLPHSQWFWTAAFACRISWTCLIYLPSRKRRITCLTFCRFLEIELIILLVKAGHVHIYLGRNLACAHTHTHI